MATIYPQGNDMWYPTNGKGNSSSQQTCEGDILVPRRVLTLLTKTFGKSRKINTIHLIKNGLPLIFFTNLVWCILKQQCRVLHATDLDFEPRNSPQRNGVFFWFHKFHTHLEPQGQPFINGWKSIGWWTKSLHRKWLEITKHLFINGHFGSSRPKSIRLQPPLVFVGCSFWKPRPNCIWGGGG